MKIKGFKIVLSSVVGCIFYFIFGWFVFEFLIGSYMQSHTTNLIGFKKSESDSNITMLVLSCLAYSVLLSIIFGCWSNITTFKKGLSTGALIGVLIALMTDSYWYSTSHFYNSLMPLVIDVVAAGITVGLLGGGIGWILGYKK